MIKSYNVTINGKNFFDEFGLLMQKKEISAAVPKTKYIDIPCADGKIDISDKPMDEIVYETRLIKLKFYSKYKIEDWSLEISKLNSEFAGKKCRFVFDDDISFYWEGRITSIQPNYDGPNEYISLEAVVDPYKYDIETSAVDWEWDIFDFEDGIINETGELIVDGIKEITLICRKKRIFPFFTSSAPMTVEYDSETYNLNAGTQKLYGLFLKEGNNTLKFRGNGTVSIDYQGGTL